ncbi:MAG: aminodeoxychorismate/anthranilate synthase component II [Betaproteobacteria bacterium AqS2]|uniref:Aminodeoxychorismate/anthranilate synthase component II n=1 Tax=Candidatus Amphirhobacter heronislandensis TaxID=1732024 RepID=A0A930UIS0_9GAMM|nr:aminodeoxychorismate/anthranilate synthase component II [Betaproteobacteria bacterium AqS2]
MIFLLDNYDSFTYNLYQMLRADGREVEVARNDAVAAEDVVAKKPACVLLSPGPGRPEDAGVLLQVVEAAVAARLPLFGVCLGMQAIGMHFGAEVVAAKELMHGKTCRISHDGTGVFEKLESPLTVMRYHSLALAGLPAELKVTATSDEGDVMALRHAELPVAAVQFHPESFATERGMEMLANFIDGR